MSKGWWLVIGLADTYVLSTVRLLKCVWRFLIFILHYHFTGSLASKVKWLIYCYKENHNTVLYSSPCIMTICITAIIFAPLADIKINDTFGENPEFITINWGKKINRSREAWRMINELKSSQRGATCSQKCSKLLMITSGNFAIN